MKKAVWLLILLSVLLCPALAKNKMPWAPENVIAIHIGPMNPTFDGTKYPDIKFYYTPELNWTTEKVTGTPVLLTKWLNQGLRMEEGIVLDKNGNGAFIGFIMRGKRLEDNFSQGDLDKLGNVLKSVIEENRATPHTTKKPLKLDDLSGILGKQFPDFEVEDSAGEKTTTKAIIYEANELPTLVYFFHIPYDHKFQDVEAAVGEAQTPMQFLAGISSMSAGDEYLSTLERLESELYGR